MKRYDKLIFVGADDTSIGPMANAIAQRELALEDILIASRGLVVLFPEPVNPKAEAILASHSLTMKTHMSTQLTEADFDERNLILAVNEEVLERLRNEFAVTSGNVWSLTGYIGEKGELPDPYGGALTEYGHCFERLEELIRQLADKLVKEDM